MSVKQIMKIRIIAFCNAALTNSGWRDLIKDGDVKLVERLVKVYKSPHKCHRSVLDTEKQFLDHVADMMKRDETIAESGR